jgi:hypothetical protein
VILSSLRWYFERTRRDVLFALVDDFKKDVLDTQVENARTRRRLPLRDALTRIVSQPNTAASG